MASRLRHIAIIVPDPEKAAKFFEHAFGMTRAGTARRGIYMSDGVVNVALLKTEGEEKPGLYHFGMWVDDLDEAEKKVTEAGGSYLAGRPTSPNSFYEAKYRDPNGLVFDLCLMQSQMVTVSNVRNQRLIYFCMSLYNSTSPLPNAWWWKMRRQELRRHAQVAFDLLVWVQLNA